MRCSVAVVLAFAACAVVAVSADNCSACELRVSQLEAQLAAANDARNNPSVVELFGFALDKAWNCVEAGLRFAEPHVTPVASQAATAVSSAYTAVSAQVVTVWSESVVPVVAPLTEKAQPVVSKQWQQFLVAREAASAKLFATTHATLSASKFATDAEFLASTLVVTTEVLVYFVVVSLVLSAFSACCCRRGKRVSNTGRAIKKQLQQQKAGGGKSKARK